MGKVTPEVITAVITGGIGAFTGLSRALSSFNNKLERRFERLEAVSYTHLTLPTILRV